MRFQPVFNKLINQYFFIQNLSEWHQSNRKAHNKHWRKILPKFSSDEERSLQEFKQIHKRYPFNKRYLGRYFFLESDPWRKIKEVLPVDDFDKIKSIFALWQEKFEIIYQQGEKGLAQWKKELEKYSDQQTVTQIQDILNALYQSQVESKTIKIFLLLSSPHQSGGGANLDDQSVTVEVSDQDIHELSARVSHLGRI